MVFFVRANYERRLKCCFGKRHINPRYFDSKIPSKTRLCDRVETFIKFLSAPRDDLGISIRAVRVFPQFFRPEVDDDMFHLEFCHGKTSILRNGTR